MSVTSIRLQKELEIPLEELARKHHRSKNWLINQAIKEYVEKEDVEEKRWADTLQALESVKQGKVVESEDVHRWLKSWGKEDELPPPKV